MPLPLGVAGVSGPEKTAFMESLALALAARGLKPGLALALGDDRPAPAIPRLEAAPQGWRVAGPLPPSLDEMLARHFDDCDLVLSELHLDQRFLKIELLAPGQAPVLADDPGLRALVGEPPAGATLPCFSPGDAPGLAAHLAEKVLPPPKPHLARILADGRRLPAKDFVEQIVAGTIRALVSTLKGAREGSRLEIHL